MDEDKSIAGSAGLALCNGRVFDGARWHDDRAVLIDGGAVAALVPAAAVPAGWERRDLGGARLAPGFIDLQVNGGGGALFGGADADAAAVALATLARAHRRYGTTGLLPTLISDRPAAMRAAAAAVAAARRGDVPGVLGVHFEGPYLNPERAGIHDRARLRGWEPDMLPLLSDPALGRVLLTLAPERVAPDVIAALSRAGVIVACGHSAADYAQTTAALAAGAAGFTHLFNAMTPLAGRAPGVVGAALDDADSWCGVIVDGHHVHPAALRVALRAKPAGKLLLVTDAMPCVGTALDAFTLYGEPIEVRDGRCRNAAGTLAGSALDMAAAVRNAIRLLGIDAGEALRMASLYPARALALDDRYGRIAAGYRADLVLLDDDGCVLDTWIGGVADPDRRG